MRSLVYFHVPQRRVSGSLSADPLVLPKLAAGQQLTIATRFADMVNGSRFETQYYVRAIRATIGPTDARPESGTVRIKILSGPSSAANTTAAINATDLAPAVQSAMNALSGKPADIIVEQDAGSWIVSRADGGELQISAIENKLKPISFLRVTGSQLNDRWVYEVRPTQAPYAFTSDFALVDPAAPTIEVVRDGGMSEGGVFKWSEVQALRLPADFRGVYQIRDPRTGARTILLDRTDRIENIQAAVQAILAEGESVVVTLPEDRVAHLTFGGDLAGIDLEPFEIVVFSAPPGDPTFTLALDHPRLLEALRANEEIREVPFEIEYELVRTEAELTDPDAEAEVVKSSGLRVTLTRPVAWDGLAAAATVPWLRPPSATSWKPFHPSQVGVGQLHYEETIGDGASTTFVIDHNLGSQALTGFVLINESTGYLVKTGYSVRVLSENSIELVFDAAPIEDGFRVIIATPHELSVFLAGLVLEIGQVDGLQTLLDEINAAIAALQAVLPTTGPGINTTATSMKIDIRDDLFLFPDTRVQDVQAALEIDGSGDEARLPKIDEAALPRPPYLLPAIHDQSVTVEFDDDENPLPAPEDDIRQVRIAAADVLLSGGGGIRSHIVTTGGFAGSDGRLWYAVNHVADTRSYFPAAFERDLFVLPFTEQMLRVGATLEIAFDFAARLVRANCKAEVYLALQFGTYNAVGGAPTPPAPNLSSVSWRNAPSAHAHRIVLSRNEITHRLGLRVKRLADSLVADRFVGGVWESAADAPPSANFAVRARLIRFDTEDHGTVADPRGYLLGGLFNARATVAK